MKLDSLDAIATYFTSGIRSPATRSRWRWAGWMAVIFGAGVLFARLWLITGLVRTARIEGGSMAETLLGEHYQTPCGDCGFAFHCDAEDTPASGRVACPNCGKQDNRLVAANLRAGDTVLIDRWPLLWSPPRRWDVVMLKEPENGELVVKRLVGLPGERLEIRDGDLYASGVLLRKALSELRQMAVLVHDNDFPGNNLLGSGGPNSESPWRPRSAALRWQPTGKQGFRFVPTANDASGELTPDWLEYHHQRPADSPKQKQEQEQKIARQPSHPIFDADYYNQGPLVRQFHEAHDLLLTANVRAAGSGKLTIAMTDGGDRFELVLTLPRSQLEIRQNGERLSSDLPPLDFPPGETRLEAAVCDQQLLLALNGRTILRREYQRTAPAGAGSENKNGGGPAPARIALAMAGGQIELNHLRVLRDIYYLPPLGKQGEWRMETELAADCFAVLGDNQPISVDSRHWPPQAIPRAAIRGVVTLRRRN